MRTETRKRFNLTSASIATFSLLVIVLASVAGVDGLTPGQGRIAGTLTDGSGAPRGDVEVFLRPNDPHCRVPIVHAPTDEKGRFFFSRIPAGLHRLEIRDEEPVRRPRELVLVTDPDAIGEEPLAPLSRDREVEVLVEADTRSQVDVTVRRSGTVEGVVRDPAGRPLRARIVLVSADGERRGLRTVHTWGLSDVDGSYRIKADPGRWQAIVPRTSVASAAFDLAPGGVAVVDLVRPDTNLSGRVLSDDGRPARGARIRARPLGDRMGLPWLRRASSDGAPTGPVADVNGEFRISGLHAGAWQLVAVLPDGRRIEREAAVEEGVPVRLVLRP